MKLLSFDVGGPQRFGVWIACAVANLTQRLGGQGPRSTFNDEPISFFSAGLSAEDDSGAIFFSVVDAQDKAKALLGTLRYVPNDEPSLYFHQASRAPR